MNRKKIFLYILLLVSNLITFTATNKTLARYEINLIVIGSFLFTVVTLSYILGNKVFKLTEESDAYDETNYVELGKDGKPKK